MRKTSRGQIALCIVMLLLLVLTLYPFWHVVMYTLSDPTAAMRGGIFLWPRGFTLRALSDCLSDGRVLTAYRNTIFVTAVGTALNLLLTVLFAYPLSLARFKWRGFLNIFVFITMLFGGGMIPGYLLIRGLGLLNTYWSLWLPGLISAWNMFIMRNYFKSLPESLEESASLDGANTPRILFQIILPLSVPILATEALWYGVGHWNSYFGCILYINNESMQVLQVYLRRILTEKQAIQRLIEEGGGYGGEIPMTAESVKTATVLISVAPILVVYPFIQRFFIKGIIVGSIKG